MAVGRGAQRSVWAVDLRRLHRDAHMGQASAQKLREECLIQCPGTFRNPGARAHLQARCSRTHHQQGTAACIRPHTVYSTAVGSPTRSALPVRIQARSPAPKARRLSWTRKVARLKHAETAKTTWNRRREDEQRDREPSQLAGQVSGNERLVVNQLSPEPDDSRPQWRPKAMTCPSALQRTNKWQAVQGLAGGSVRPTRPGHVKERRRRVAFMRVYG